ncbi:Twinfilin-1, partial [Physocladia obscura]
MALSGGLTVALALVDAFAAANNSENEEVRGLRVEVVDNNTALAATGSLPATANFAADFVALVPALLDRPCFVLVRLPRSETGAGAGAGAATLLDVPDSALVRTKMLYAASKAALVRGLESVGDAQIVDTLHATSLADLTLDAYHAHTKAKLAHAPLSAKEQEARDLARAHAEDAAAIGSSARRDLAFASLKDNQRANFGFAFTDDANAAITSLASQTNSELNLVILSIESVSETIFLVANERAASPDSIASFVPDPNSPFFVFYQYSLDPSNDALVLFFYVCPPSSKVKARMLFSSSRAAALDHVESTLGVPIAKK